MKHIWRHHVTESLKPVMNSADVSISQMQNIPYSAALVTSFVFDLCRTCRKTSISEGRTNTTVFTARHRCGGEKET